MRIEDGAGTGSRAEVNAEQQLVTKAITETRVAHISYDEGQCYSIVAEDAGPVAAEYTLYFKNDKDGDFIVEHVETNNVDADVVWKLHLATGTSAGTAIVPINLNLGSGRTAEATCRGGAGGVTGLSSSSVIAEWFGGSAYHRTVKDFAGTLVIPKNAAIAIEYDAGTGGKAAIVMTGHYHS